MADGRFRPGERKTGRVKGTPNKATADVKALAGRYGPDAVIKLAQLGGLMANEPAAESEQARVAACREILDRAYGKPQVSADITLGGGLSIQVMRFAVDDADAGNSQA